MCFAQGHNAMTPVRLESTASRSRVKHSTTEPLRSLKKILVAPQNLKYVLKNKDISCFKTLKCCIYHANKC